ncbi:MAG TPA: DJ-1/PfpI family protein [Kiritimatiellia bacterium]|nr:DJ-1/PfpI family protein [Kiritimatiellia bacterium]HRZ13478.1 DJ-1/PfpI family protein [Kiritimatiellia bacterium]HSA19644.1 DJ-1/PfpI family protein [Kiritimatiellia bacterium]
MTRVLVPLAEGCEEMEAVIIIDVLRRAGWAVTGVGLQPGPVRGSRGVILLPDAEWDETNWAEFDLLVLPGGGPGTQRLAQDARVLAAVKGFNDAGKRLAAVCAAPLVLQQAGVLDGRKATCHPSLASRLTRARYMTEPVVVDGRITTSQSAGTCLAFALELIRQVDGDGKVREVREGLAM